MSELQYKVVLDSNTPSDLVESVGFGDFTPTDTVSVVYGEDELLRFYNELILGRPLPLTFVARGVSSLGVFFALTLFLQRDLALHPKTAGIVTAVSLFDHYGVSGLAHVDRDLSRILKALSRVLMVPPNGPDGQHQILKFAFTLCRDYIEKDVVPTLPAEPNPPAVLDRGTNGFVMASYADERMAEGWEELYRLGHLRGVLLRPIPGTERWDVLGSRKSLFVSLDLVKAAAALNDAEVAMGEPPEWASDGLWLRGPEQGTLLLPTMIVRILLVC